MNNNPFANGIAIGFVIASTISVSIVVVYNYCYLVDKKLDSNDEDKNKDNNKDICKSNLVNSSKIIALKEASLIRNKDKNRTRIFRLGSRSSDLAMIQTYWVKEHLENIYPDLYVDIKEGVNARGDIVLDQSLKRLATQDPGIFTKELEAGLLENEYDAVVHSLKDMPTKLPNGLVLASITEREDPRDALVLRSDLRNIFNPNQTNHDLLTLLPKGSIIGTSSVRREAFIKQGYPHLQVKIIRGNVNTRLAKLDRGEFDAIILAAAGLKRLGQSFENRIDEYLESPNFFYGVVSLYLHK